MALSDAEIRAAKTDKAQYKLYNKGGLFLIVRPSRGKLWRLKYRHLGKEQQLSIGRYPGGNPNCGFNLSVPFCGPRDLAGSRTGPSEGRLRVRSGR